jgi:hypothetical protein
VRCARCGARSRGASWYCANCGAPLPDLNVADSVGRRPLPGLVRWSLGLSAVALVVVGALALATVVRRVMDPVSAPADQPVARDAGTDAAADVATPPGPGPIGSQNVPVKPPATVVPPATATEFAAAATIAPTIATGGGPVGPTPFIRPDVPVWRIPRLARPPVDDGDLREWPTEAIDIVAVVFGREHWDGPEDLSARAVAGWDDGALHFGVQVVDDVFAQGSTGARLYLGDSLEVQLDTDLVGDLAAGHYSDDDWQIGLSPGDFAARAPETHVWRPRDRTPTGVRLGARRLDNGYVVEASVPWALIGFDPAAARSLGFALNVSDNDDPEPAQLTMISVAPERSWGDPRTFAVLVLEGR